MTLDHPILTHDERKAAEAAFQGRPFDPLWTQKAQRIYDGIRVAQANRPTKSQAADVVPPVRTTIASPSSDLHYSDSPPSFLGSHRVGSSNIRTRRSAAWKCVQARHRSSNS